MGKTYQIPVSNLPRLEAEINRLNKRAEKLSLPPVKFEVVAQHSVEREDALGFKYTVVYHECQVIGEAPRIRGWKFVAVLEPVENGLIVREVPGQSCPIQFRTTDSHCDHCKTTRRRNAIFVLECTENGNDQKTGEFRQVGRDCLADFLGHENPESLLAGAEFIATMVGRFSEAEDFEWGFGGSLRYKPAVPIDQFVSVVSILSRRLGWVPKSQAFGAFRQATADIAWTICRKPHDKWVADFVLHNNLQAEAKDIEIARAAIEWAKAIGPGTSNTYLYNLGVLCREDCVVGKNSGYVASVIEAYRKRVSAEIAKKVTAESQFVGEVGKRQDFEELVIQYLKEREGTFGVKTQVRFLDPKGNVLQWWASGSPDWLEVGKRVNVRATVEKHERYCETNQTLVKRVALVEELPSNETDRIEKLDPPASS